MRPARFRNGLGVGALGTVSIALLATRPAIGADLMSASLVPGFSGAAPIAMAVGGTAFGVIATVLLARWKHEGGEQIRRAESQLAGLRARLDDAQALLEGMPELTVRWRDGVSPPQVFGPVTSVLPSGMTAADTLDFTSWLEAAEARELSEQLAQLRETGESFDLSLATLDGRAIRALGRTIGAAAVLRLRPAFAATADDTRDALGPRLADRAGAEAIFSLIGKAAWVRDPKGTLVYGNSNYRKIMRQLGVQAAPGELCEIFETKTVRHQLTALQDASGAVTFEKAIKLGHGYDLVLFPLSDGTAGYLRSRDTEPTGEPVSTDLAQIGSVINALRTPIAIFDARRQLVQANKAYTTLWELEPEWLTPGLKEQVILDRLRTKGLLPAEVDYRAWRNEHLKSYSLVKPRETMWHLPDGRTINVVAVPASASGGIVYAFEDQTEHLALESRFNALTHVQSETINALSEGVAVFGTNGRLALANAKLSTLWKLPMNELGKQPHIDAIGEACASAMPEDGAVIWRDLKQLIVDLNPTRADKTGRIRRADGRLIDYAAVRMPDGQTMITFVDVTESANYQRVLQERNDALVTADKLKDAFVQNVSYELRSPLTNIIGFADLLASGSAGELNEKQKSYTDYIRASSATLGVLIDNILDLTNVDAGISELNLEEQDVGKLVDLARAGLAATFSAGAGETPLNLSVEIANDLPRFVADGQRIVQILYNLLSNAARFSEAGSEVKLKIQTRGDERIVFIVEDEGVGIPEEMRAAMFRRFEGKSVEGRQRGAGLGLAIVRAFVNLHGGTISFEKREPKGTRVIVNLPAVAVTDAAGAAE